MFVIELIYTADLAAIDARMKPHMAFLRKHYAAGNFLVSGRKVPRDGGIILAVAGDRAQVEAIVKEDPFVAEGLADYRIIEFRASQRADDISARIDRVDGADRRRT
ncbi:MAG TPA: YciI family protein [Kofleriaceae bacterium]